MLNNKAFTLVELMVVIVMIGVLAALGMQKFSYAINKAKASELPTVMSQIATAQNVFHQESNIYAEIKDDSNWQKSLKSILGLEIQSRLFRYYITDGTFITYKAHARVVTPFGDIKGTSTEAVMDAQGFKMYVNDTNKALEKYTKAWYGQ